MLALQISIERKNLHMPILIHVVIYISNRLLAMLYVITYIRLFTCFVQTQVTIDSDLPTLWTW